MEGVMKKLLLLKLALFQFTLVIALSSLSLAQEWVIGGPRGTITVVDLFFPTTSAMLNYAEGLLSLDKDNRWVPCLARNWRWIDARTIEFKLRRGVTFHNGEQFNAEALQVNWEQYRSLDSPRVFSFMNLSDETMLEIIDKYTVRFTLPEPDGLALVKFQRFFQAAPSFFKKHKVAEKNWLYFPEAGPWGTGPFEFIEGSGLFGNPSDRLILKANEDYWDAEYPKVERVIFDNTLVSNRDEAMRLCREEEGAVDIVSHIRPLDTLKVAESRFAKVVKSKDITNLGAWFNQRKRGSKWKDIRLRRAVNYAVNRQELWKYGAKGNAHNFGVELPPGAYGQDPDLTPYEYDTERARLLLAEAGYPNGFDVKMISIEAWKLEAQIVSKMLERVGLKVKLEVLTSSEMMRKIYIPILDKPPEEQEWDLNFGHYGNWWGHTGASFYSWYIDASDYRWNQFDPIYEEMWKDMAGTVDRKAQEEKIRQMSQYVHENALHLTIYSPLTLYAVNKEVDFIPQRFEMMRLKETSVTDKHWSISGGD
jgi:peptide/nickel transport system substrate-binding protein